MRVEPTADVFSGMFGPENELNSSQTWFKILNPRWTEAIMRVKVLQYVQQVVLILRRATASWFHSASQRHEIPDNLFLFGQT